MVRLTLLIFSLVIGTGFLFTKSAGALAGFLTAPPYVKCTETPVECNGTCNYAEAMVCCDADDHALGGGIKLDLGLLPDNTDAADNVAAQNSHPEEPNCWFVSARELQNVPGSFGKNADGTGGGNVGPDCEPTADSACYTNWNSTSAVPDPSISATGFLWTIEACVVCSEQKK